MLEQIRAWASQRQILVVAAAAGAFATLLIGGWLLFFRASYEPLFTDLRPADAATIVADLDKRRIAYRLADGGATILVPTDQVDATRLAVMSSDLPLKGTVGFELFNKSDMGLTDFAQRINYQRALQGELERTIMTLDGVEFARVHLSLGEDRIFRDDRVPPKASVTVRMRGGAALAPKAAQGVQRLVAAAVPQLDAANVVILDERGGVVGAPVAPRAAETLSPALEEKRAVEQYYEARIRAVLDQAYSRDSIAVSVEAAVAVSPDGEGLATPALQSQDATTRTFGLRVSLSPRQALPADWQDNARTLVGQAIGTTNGDSIVFAPPGEVAAAAPFVDDESRSVPDRTIDASGPATVEDPGWLLETALAAAPIALLLAGLVVLRRARKPRRLSTAERTAFAAKLRLAMVGEDSRGQS